MKIFQKEMIRKNFNSIFHFTHEIINLIFYEKFFLPIN